MSAVLLLQWTSSTLHLPKSTPSSCCYRSRYAGETACDELQADGVPQALELLDVGPFYVTLFDSGGPVGLQHASQELLHVACIEY